MVDKIKDLNSKCIEGHSRRHDSSHDAEAFETELDYIMLVYNSHMKTPSLILHTASSWP